VKIIAIYKIRQFNDKGLFNMGRMDFDPIKLHYFYNSEEDKTKINWFCYEYAYVLYDNIRKTAMLKKYRDKNTQDEIVRFCVDFAKEVKSSIYRGLYGVIEKPLVYEKYVGNYYPQHTTTDNFLLLNVATRA
jgi:hypothetical protein